MCYFFLFAYVSGFSLGISSQFLDVFSAGVSEFSREGTGEEGEVWLGGVGSSGSRNIGGATNRESRTFSIVISTDRVMRRSSAIVETGMCGNSCCTCELNKKDEFVS